ncbi:unnamed protein product [Schistocephalus solidus]|uniref:Uncharacterized protein n=1 Tax=Schistocephalus solidus TaxID=70667 RepID=A0A3P7BF93_SCHSO|nr:unnamed protein product [Schistocephalus solidus]
MSGLVDVSQVPQGNTTVATGTTIAAETATTATATTSAKQGTGITGPAHDLLCPLQTKAVHLGDLMRIWVRPTTKIMMPPLEFQGPTRVFRTPQKGWCFTEAIALPPENLMPGLVSTPYKEKKTPTVTPVDVSEFGCVTQLRIAQTRTTAAYAEKANTDGPAKPLPISLGRVGNIYPIPVHSGPPFTCPTVVPMEPFSISAFKVLTYIFATTTKIYTHSGSTQTHVQASTLTMTNLLLTTASLPGSGLRKTATDCCLRNWPFGSRTKQQNQRSSLRGWPGIGQTLQGHPFSGLVISATDMEEPSPSDSKSTGQPPDTHSTYTGPTACYGVSVRLAAFAATKPPFYRVYYDDDEGFVDVLV